MAYTIPQWFSTAPSTLLIATTPLKGYSDIETISCIYYVLMIIMLDLDPDTSKSYDS